jgi:hypothetical protein
MVTPSTNEPWKAVLLGFRPAAAVTTDRCALGQATGACSAEHPSRSGTARRTPSSLLSALRMRRLTMQPTGESAGSLGPVEQSGGPVA